MVSPKRPNDLNGAIKSLQETMPAGITVGAGWETPDGQRVAVQAPGAPVIPPPRALWRLFVYTMDVSVSVPETWKGFVVIRRMPSIDETRGIAQEMAQSEALRWLKELRSATDACIEDVSTGRINIEKEGVILCLSDAWEHVKSRHRATSRAAGDPAKKEG